jgi:hypothetical protein
MTFDYSARDYVPATELADLPEMILRAIADDLASTLSRPMPGSQSRVLLLRDDVRRYLEGESDRLKVEIEEGEAEAARIFAEARKLTGVATNSSRRGQLTRQARRASAEAYQCRKDIDAVHDVLRRLYPADDRAAAD